MRKRIFIGLLAVVVMGVVAFFVSQPKKGSVEWHKREYLAAHNSSRLEDWIGRGPEWLQDGYWNRQQKRIEFHRQELINLGYLEERIFVLSNVPFAHLSYGINFATQKKGTNFHFCKVAIGTNTVGVVNIKGTLPTMEEVLAEVDSAANKSE